MVVVFDLDDTLYDELNYVRSGFQTVADYLFAAYQIPSAESYNLLIDFLQLGRGKIFDKVLDHYGRLSKAAVRHCLSVYRQHLPVINLRPEADRCLKRLTGYPVYIVTDGNKLVQYNKIKALGLETRLRGYYITHRFGVRHAKPSPYCFLKICEREKVSPFQVVYIADNPDKDFVGINPFGFRTVRLLQGQHKKVQDKSPAFAAQYSIASLDELFILLSVIENE